MSAMTLAEAYELFKGNLTLMFETYEHRRIREQIEQTRRHGLLMGLTEDQIQEVVKAWEHHHLSRPTAVDWVAVRESLACRARGEDWKPLHRTFRLE